MNMQLPQPDYATNLFNITSGLLRWRPVIERILYRSKTYRTFNDITNDVVAGRMIWFDTGVAFALVQVDQRSLGTIVHVYAAGGAKKHMFPLEEMVIQFAKSIDARKVTTLGRKGFLKWKEQHMKPTGQVQFELEL